MDETTTTSASAPSLGDWSNPIEDGVRGRVRAFIEAILEEELGAALGRARYERTDEGPRGWRNGHRDRRVIGTFGPETVRVPRARLAQEDGTSTEWRSKGLRRYQRLTKRTEALIAGAYLGRAPTRAACAARSSGAVRRSGRQGRGQPRVAQGEDRLGSVERPRARQRRTSSGSSSTARWSGRGSTARRPPSRCWWRSACAGTARRSCWR